MTLSVSAARRLMAVWISSRPTGEESPMYRLPTIAAVLALAASAGVKRAESVV